ncbi:MAG: hypothetical protein D6794_04950 [Deltaproteobacteria bacterium]|nr:MAG: hypothetical protein D6794_04950 [Deltaproteobacteria bacterium]
MTQTKTLTLALVLVLLAAMSAPSFARGRGHGGRHHRCAPPEAIEACEGKSAGDRVEFTGRRGETVEATCQEHDGKLVAVPNDAPEPEEK